MHEHRPDLFSEFFFPQISPSQLRKLPQALCPVTWLGQGQLRQNSSLETLLNSVCTAPLDLDTGAGKGWERDGGPLWQPDAAPSGSQPTVAVLLEDSDLKNHRMWKSA